MATQMGADDAEEGLVGQATERREDHRLITGEASYADDLTRPRQTHLAFARSQYGHARIEEIDTSEAEAMDDVVAVYTAEDVREDGLENRLPGDDPDHGVVARRRILAEEKVRYHGEAIAGIVAEDRATAQKAAESIDVEYERLDAIPDVESALEEDAPTVHEHAPDNVAFEWESGDLEATEEVFAAADRVVETDIEINRVMAVPMEPRAALAAYEPSAGRLTLEVSCQDVFYIQDNLSEMFDLPEHRISVRAPDVGGGFGVKIQEYTGHVLASWASIQIERPVAWTATRTESLQSTHHSRRHSVTARAAIDGDDTIVGLHMESYADVGAYLSQFASLVAGSNVGTRFPGAYDVPTAAAEITGYFTNTTPMSAYRGAGRPEATYIIERLVSACARELDVDPAEFRRQNFIPPEKFPYEGPLGPTYDSGDYEKALDEALEHVDYEEFRERQRAAREERYLGIGLSTYIEVCGGTAGQLQGGRVRMLPSGKVIAYSSMVENGQGHETGFAQIVASELGVDYDDVEIIEGDTDRVPEGGGTGGSKAMSMGGNALKASAESLRDRARRIAAHELEAAPEDVEFEDGTFAVAGVPDRSLTIQEVAERSYSAHLPQDLRGLEDTTFFSPEGSTAPFGTHVVVVEIDPDTGEIEFERYVAVDDVGTQINPTLIEGQIVGGVVQSIGQAIFEQVEYDDNATLVSASLQDYALPRSLDVPEIEWHSTVTPSPNNPLGVKGVGEAGTIAAMPAIVNAVIDALEPLGIDEIDMPLTQERVWRAIQGARESE